MIRENNGSGVANKKSLTQIYLITKKIYFFLAIFSGSFSLVVGSWLIYEALNKSSNIKEAWFCWFFVILTASIRLYSNSRITLLQGLNLIAISQRYQLVVSLLSVTTSTMIILYTKSMLYGVLFFYGWQILGHFYISFLINKYFIPDVFLEEKKEIRLFFQNVIWPATWKTGVGAVFSFGLIQFSGLIITKIETAEVAGAYLLSLQFIRTIANFSQVPFYSKLPFYTELYSENKINQLVGYSLKAMTKTYYLYAFAFFIIGFWGDEILRLLGSNLTLFDKKLWVLLGIAIFLESYCNMNLELYSLTNRILWHRANLFTGVSSIFLSVLLFPVLGIYGFIISMIISYLMIHSFYSVRVRYIWYKLNFFETEKYSLFPVLLMLVPIIIVVLYV